MAAVLRPSPQPSPRSFLAERGSKPFREVVQSRCARCPLSDVFSLRGRLGGENMPLMSLIVCRLGLVMFLWCLIETPLGAAEMLWKAGIAKANITPAEPVWLAGYG